MNRHTKSAKLTLISILILSTSFGVYASEGELDSTFGNGGFLTTDTGAALQPDGKTVFIGNLQSNPKSAQGRFVGRANADGSIDKTFSGDGFNFNPSPSNSTISFNAVGIQLSGKTLLGGRIINSNDERDFMIARLDASSISNRLNGKIAFLSDRTGNSEIFTMNPNGSNQTNISNNTANEYSHVWSTNGRKIAFVRHEGNGVTNIYTMDADGSNQFKVTNALSNSREPSWSPDGRKIAFARGSSIFLINVDGTNETLLNVGLGYHAMPKFSPDGTKVTYLCARPFDGEPPTVNDDICVINADGTNEINISHNPRAEFSPIFSSDSSKVAFIRDTGGSSEIYIADVDGGNLVNLTNSSASNDRVSFSPDSSKIAFVTNRDGNTEIYSMNIDGSNLVNLSNNSASEGSPEFSPDGSKIAFATNRDGNFEIYVMNSDGTNQTRLTDDLASDGTPKWQTAPMATVPFDFDGDGKTDASVFRNGNWFIQPTTANNPNTYYTVTLGESNDKLVPADYDGDGRADVAVWRENVSGNQSFFYIMQSETNTLFTYQFGNTGDDPGVVGDWDGDGKADLAVYRQATNAGEQSLYYYIPSSAANPFYVVIPWGTSEDETVRGDFDGDGKSDAAVFRPSNGVWYILQSSNNEPLYRQWGISTDLRTTGEFDGDGKSDLVIFRDGVWYVLQSSNNQARYAYWGLDGNQVVPGDYDGDGLTDFAVWKDGIYYIMQNSDSQVKYQYFGLPSDIPVASAFVN